MLVALLTYILKKFLFGRLAKARGQKPCQKNTIRGLRPKLRRDWEHENESKNFGIFKEISGFLGSSLGICTKLQLATLEIGRKSIFLKFFGTVVVLFGL